MMKTSTKLLATGVASMLGVALAAAGVNAAAGALTASDAPGQILQVSGIGPASAQASTPAKADVNAKGPSGATTARATTAPPTARATTPATTTQTAVRQVARPAPQMLPGYHDVMHSGEMAHH
ncbi:MAG TPA: hypothetical protein VIJ07_11715 [Dermatophilaceae bacterium]